MLSSSIERISIWHRRAISGAACATNTTRRGRHPHQASSPVVCWHQRWLEARHHALPLPPVSLRAAALFLRLLALGDEIHFLTKRLGDPLGNDAFVKASDKL